MSSREGNPVLLEELTSAEFKSLIKKKPLAIIPVGSVEEHGSHLPLCTDSFQAEEVARRVALAFGGFVCPPLRYGDCRSTRNFPGTISISFDTLRMLITDIVSELDRNGVDKILVITGHAGSAHMIALRLGVQAVVERNPKLRVMLLSDYDLAYELRGKEIPAGDGHGGLIETSRIMNIRPELVRARRPKGDRWAPQFMVVADPEKYFPTGVLGDSSWASGPKGKKIDDYVVGRLCDLISENFGIRRT
jgi:creatinine amidohydrolase